MSSLKIIGGRKLKGEIVPRGNKNAALPIVCASLLTNETVTIRNVPNISDMDKLIELMISLGSKINWDRKEHVLEINNSEFKDSFGDKGFPLGMRGAVLLLGPLVSRMKEITVKSEIGGCALGIRELDPHIDVIKALGAEVEVNNGNIHINTHKGLSGGDSWQDYMSVTTTENFIMAASRAKGKSVITNAASEPHVQDLCNFLIKMGAKINGVGSCRVEVEGVDKLHGADFTLSSDHHEIATFLAIGAMTGGDVRVKNAIPEQMTLINRCFEKVGVNIEYDGDTAIVKNHQKFEILEPYTKNLLQKVEAAPWPYFPVDLLPLLVALSLKSKGSIMFWNKLYEGGFFWIPEAIRFGAHIVMCDPHRIIVYGDKPLKPASVIAPDIIRSTVALMMIALSIEGESTIHNSDSIDRAYPGFVEQLNKLGAHIEVI